MPPGSFSISIKCNFQKPKAKRRILAVFLAHLAKFDLANTDFSPHFLQDRPNEFLCHGKKTSGDDLWYIK